MTKKWFLFLCLLLFSNLIYAEDTTTIVTNVPNNNAAPPATKVTTKISTTSGPKTMSDADQLIVSTIYAKYSKSAALIGTGINVLSQDGIVSLTGNVTAQSQADEAASLAKSTLGVKDVRSSIVVLTHPPSTTPGPQRNY